MISSVHLSPTRSSARASGDHWSYGWRLGGGVVGMAGPRPVGFSGAYPEERGFGFHAAAAEPQVRDRTFRFGGSRKFSFQRPFIPDCKALAGADTRDFGISRIEKWAS